MNADIYSLGVILYQLIFGNYPYIAKNDALLLNEIKSKKPSFTLNGVNISKDLENLLTRMLDYDPKRRITWKEVHSHAVIVNHKKKGALEIDLNPHNIHKSVYMSEKDVQNFYDKKEKNELVIVKEEKIEIEWEQPKEPKKPDENKKEEGYP